MTEAQKTTLLKLIGEADFAHGKFKEAQGRFVEWHRENDHKTRKAKAPDVCTLDLAVDADEINDKLMKFIATL